MEYEKLREVRSQHLSSYCYMQRVLLEGGRTVKNKTKKKKLAIAFAKAMPINSNIEHYSAN